MLVVLQKIWEVLPLSTVDSSTLSPNLCWLLGTSVRKIEDCAVDFCIGLAAIAFVDEGIKRVSRSSTHPAEALSLSGGG